MKVLLCAIAKNENNYLREWVEYYFNLGFDNIILYDNNDKEGEHFEEVIKDYIDSGFVIVKDVRGIKEVQIKSYNECYHSIPKKYKWIFFCDIDEFLEIDNHLKIKKFIKLKQFKHYDGICINWKLFDDNNLIRVKDNNYSIKRFTHPTTHCNNECKRILKTNLNITLNSSNGITTADGTPSEKFKSINLCNVKGEPIDIISYYINNNTWEIARLNHYRFKTLEEYLTNKMPKGYATSFMNAGKDFLTLNTFFRFNNKTPEKLEYLKKRGIKYK